MKKGFFMLTSGIMIGYCLVRSVVYLQDNYFWTWFYR